MCQKHIQRALIYSLLFILLIFTFSISQERVIRDKVKDTFKELETDSLTLRFFNALTGNPIAGADVAIKNLGQFKTDQDGRAIFPVPKEDGEYSVSFCANGYLTSDFSIEIMAGTIFFNRFSISPAMDIRYFRVVLDWDMEPPDLDEHFVKEGSYHVSYRDMKTSEDGTGHLDHDAMHGYGPETITIEQVLALSKYEFYVHNYSDKNIRGSMRLSQSKAAIKVFGNGTLLRVFKVPRNKSGNYWHVFKIINGEIEEDNRITE